MTFAVRGDILGELRAAFSLSNEDVGLAAGAWAYGFTLSIFIGGQLVDLLGMRRIMLTAFLTHVLGVALTVLASGFWTLFAGTLAIGLGNGLVEAFINPLTATIYPERKTEKLNLLHVWFPGGIVIGGLAAFALTGLGLGWQAKMAFILLPVLAYGALFLGQPFPRTERVQQGISTASMYRALLRPLFLVLVFSMILTSSTELATNQWIANILSSTAGLAAGGILVLVWINGLMAVSRWFAGPMVHRLSAIGLLIASAVLSAIGLVGLSFAHSPLTAVLAATVFAVGVCYFWPTMLGVTSERVRTEARSRSPSSAAPGRSRRRSSPGSSADSTTAPGRAWPCATWRCCQPCSSWFSARWHREENLPASREVLRAISSRAVDLRLPSPDPSSVSYDMSIMR
jgi:fucose permease